tara:strand:- start:34 stop:228 length:195 start_codon:yes stop_codon:yes gene_type:complete
MDFNMNEELNMSIRRFLKQVGVTSQQQIEKAWKEKNPENKKVKVEMKLTISDLNLEHIIKVDLG